MEPTTDPLATIQPAALALLPHVQAKRLCALPTTFNAGVLTVAVPDPSDFGVIDTLRFFITGAKELRFVKAGRDAIRAAIELSYKRPAGTEGGIVGAGPSLTNPSIDLAAEKL
jgi:hypothetical protein